MTYLTDHAWFWSLAIKYYDHLSHVLGVDVDKYDYQDRAWRSLISYFISIPIYKNIIMVYDMKKTRMKV